MKWRGWKQPQMAEAVGVHQATISKLTHGRGERAPGTPGVAIAIAIERVTSEPGPDGTTWPDGPIRAEDWVSAAHVGRPLTDSDDAEQTDVTPRPGEAA